MKTYIIKLRDTFSRCYDYKEVTLPQDEYNMLDKARKCGRTITSFDKSQQIRSDWIIVSIDVKE